MKITVLNGSPKGDTSITMQYVHYMLKEFPDHDYTIHNISHRIKGIERDIKAFNEVIASVRNSGMVIWAFPLYYFLVPSQYKRFIELLFEGGAKKAFAGKYAVVLTTSIHFFDHTAHAYMRAICDDLGMIHAGGYSADMYDLLNRRKRGNFRIFLESAFDGALKKNPSPRVFQRLTPVRLSYRPGKVHASAHAGDRRVLILTDHEPGDKNLGAMVQRLNAAFAAKAEAVNIRDLDIKGGCLGCIQCGYDNTCQYGTSDGYIMFFNEKVRSSDIIFFCGAVRDRYLSWKWKQFFDRAFFNTHIPFLSGKQVGFLVSGPLGGIPFLREILEAYPGIQKGSLVDIVTDECGSSAELDALIDNLALRAVAASETGYLRPSMFPGVAGRKLFRDEVFGRLRFPFVADYRYYRKARLFDFPQKNVKGRIMNFFLMSLSKIPGFRKEIYKKRMKDEMIKPFARLEGIPPGRFPESSPEVNE